MTESMADILRSDAEISALASRSLDVSGDSVLAALGAWAVEIDRHPVRPVVVGPEVSHRRGYAATRIVALTVVLTLSSSGVAAAVKGDPWAPLTFLVAKLRTFGHIEDPGRPPLGIPDAGLPDSARGGDSAAGLEAEAQHAASRGSRPVVHGSRPDSVDAPTLEAYRSSPSGDGGSTAQSDRPSRVVPVPPHPHRRPHLDEPTPPSSDDPQSPNPWPQQAPTPPAPDDSDFPDKSGHR
jgi:hypothetical protein